MNDSQLEDRLLIRELIEAWVLWRDGGDFERLAKLWRPYGFIMTGARGLHHMQLMSENVAELIAKSDALAEAGMRPHRGVNHGPFTSFYYGDPDGDNVELTTQNFPSLEAMTEFMRSPGFKPNPLGVELDPQAFVGRFKAGVSIDERVGL